VQFPYLTNSVLLSQQSREMKYMMMQFHMPIPKPS